MSQLNVEDLEKFASDYDDHWQRLKVFFLLKTAFSPALEAVILLDRLLYLHENVRS